MGITTAKVHNKRDYVVIHQGLPTKYKHYKFIVDFVLLFSYIVSGIIASIPDAYSWLN